MNLLISEVLEKTRITKQQKEENSYPPINITPTKQLLHCTTVIPLPMIQKHQKFINTFDQFLYEFYKNCITGCDLLEQINKYSTNIDSPIIQDYLKVIDYMNSIIQKNYNDFDPVGQKLKGCLEEEISTLESFLDTLNKSYQKKLSKTQYLSLRELNLFFSQQLKQWYCNDSSLTTLSDDQLIKITKETIINILIMGESLLRNIEWLIEQNYEVYKKGLAFINESEMTMQVKTLGPIIYALRERLISKSGMNNTQLLPPKAPDALKKLDCIGT